MHYGATLIALSSAQTMGVPMGAPGRPAAGRFPHVAVGAHKIPGADIQAQVQGSAEHCIATRRTGVALPTCARLNLASKPLQREPRLTPVCSQ